MEAEWTSQGNQRLWIKMITNLVSTMDDHTTKHANPAVDEAMDRMYMQAANRATRIFRSDMMG